MFKKLFVCGLFLLLGVFAFYWYYEENLSGTQDAFAKEKLIRLRIIANSDTIEDQALKRQIRDRVIEVLGPKLRKVHDIREARVLVSSNIDEVIGIAKGEIASAGKDYPVTAALCQCPFPTKSYGAMNFPAGNYEALLIVIGKGQGQNWWCVLFPPLCFVDARQGLASKEMTEDQAMKLTVQEVNALPIEVRFKTIELLKKADKKFEEVF